MLTSFSPFFQTLRDKEQNSMDWWENLNRKPWFSPSNGNSGFNFPIIQFEKPSRRGRFKKKKRPSSAPHQRVPETHDFIRLAGSSTDGEGDLSENHRWKVDLPNKNQGFIQEHLYWGDLWKASCFSSLGWQNWIGWYYIIYISVIVSPGYRGNAYRCFIAYHRMHEYH